MIDEFAQVKLGGLWKNTSKNGKTYLSGTLGYDSNLQVWPNKKREGKDDPDYNVYITQRKFKKTDATTETDHHTETTNEVPF